MSHPFFYPEDMTGLFSYAESRGGEYDEIVFFCLQGHLIENYINNRVTKEDVKEADDFCRAHGVPFARDTASRIVTVHDGFMPVRIKALKEGTVTPVRTPLVTVESTDPALAFLTSFIETDLLRAVWYPTTIASKANAIRKGIQGIYDRYADTNANTDFAFLDFSSRGVEHYGANEVGGAAFLTSFLGSDSIAGVRWANHHYDCEMSGYSVKATEHSVMCSYGEDAESDLFLHLLNKAKPGEILSVVSDTWNIYRACEYWGKLAKLVEERGVVLSIRPDSGDYREVLPRMLDILFDYFKFHKNDKGLLVFDNLKILWGDGVSEQTYVDMLMTVVGAGFGPEVLTLGSGGGLMQNVNRDTCKFAFKASAVQRNHGEWVGIAKNPITDPGKQSKMGRIEHPGLELVYENGKMFRRQTLDEIRSLVRG